MSETNENLINSETTENEYVSKKVKEMEQSENLHLVLHDEYENEVRENGLDKKETNGLEVQEQNGIHDESEKKSEWEDLLGSGSLMKRIIKEGQPDTRPQRLERCFINYECRLEDGTLVEGKEYFEMLLGDCEVRGNFS